MTGLPADFQFSQSSLQDAADCPRRFWLRHVRQLRYPAPIAAPLAEHELHLLRGDRLHRLIQATLNGVPEAAVRASAADDPVALGWYEAWLLYGLIDIPAERRRAEVELSAPVPGFPDQRILAKYDLLAEGDGQLVIVDWKTSARPPASAALDDRWQTIIYRWLLARSRPDIAPDAITMIYWYASDPTQPIRLPYSAAQYAHDDQRIRVQIGALLSGVAVGDNSFPMTDDERRCRFCNYRTLCERGVQPGDWAEFAEDDSVDDDLRVDFEQVAEVAF